MNKSHKGLQKIYIETGEENGVRTDSRNRSNNENINWGNPGARKSREENKNYRCKHHQQIIIDESISSSEDIIEEIDAMFKENVKSKISWPKISRKSVTL